MNPAAFKAGAQLTTSSFTSFTSDEQTAKRFMGTAFHDSGFVAATQPVLFIVQGGARKITSPTEYDEGVFKPLEMFTVTSTAGAGKYLKVFLDARQGGGTGTLL